MSTAARHTALPARRDPADLDRLRLSIEEALRTHVIDCWFPRCVDSVRGGYNSDYDRRWRPRGDQHRLLEFQARQMRSAARLGQKHPEDERFVDIALHGLRYLRDVMWDRSSGGWYALVSAHGEPLLGQTKHSHGAAYAVQACAVVHELTGDSDARALAEEAFSWFDAHAHDDNHGGYFSWLTREGEVIRTAADLPAGVSAEDPVAHGIGLKDVNVLGDWLESLTEAVSILGDDAMRARLVELADLFLDRLTTPHGDVYFSFREDFQPVPQPERFGYAFQSVDRLHDAAGVLGSAPGIRERAFIIGEHAFTHGAQRRKPGFLFSGSVEAPRMLEGARTYGARRLWWVQLAALESLGIFAASDRPDADEYLDKLHATWDWLRREAVDEVYGGFYKCVPADMPRLVRPRGRFGNSPWLAKGNIWKDASHEVDSLLGVLDSLERMSSSSVGEGRG